MFLIHFIIAQKLHVIRPKDNIKKDNIKDNIKIYLSYQNNMVNISFEKEECYDATFITCVTNILK